MKTLRDKLHEAKATGNPVILDVLGAPSFIFNFSLPKDSDDTLDLSWEDEGSRFEESFELDEELDSIRVFTMQEVL